MVIALPRTLYDYFIKRWFLSTLLLTISTHWFVLLKIFGKGWGLIDTTGKLTPFAHWITWPLFGISVCFALLKTAADKYNEEGKNNAQYILERIIENVNAATSAKIRRFITYIKENYNKTTAPNFHDIAQPRLHIENLLENIQITLSRIFGINRDDIGLSIIYKFHTEDPWSWLMTINTAQDVWLGNIVKNPSTTVKQLLDENLNLKSLFFPDKKIGAEKHQYLPGPKDKSFGIVGSILCRDISIGCEHKFVRAILSISTYGKQLCRHNDRDAISKIENLIIPTFERRLRRELALLYIKEVMFPKSFTSVDGQRPKPTKT